MMSWDVTSLSLADLEDLKGEREKSGRFET